MCIGALYLGSHSFFHLDVVLVFDISLVVEACLFCEFELLTLTSLRDVVGIFFVIVAISFSVSCCILQV